MNEKIVLKNGKEYPLVIGGTSSTPSTLRLIFQTMEPLEDIVAVFTDAAAIEQIKTVNEDGSTLAVYDGYTVLDNPKALMTTISLPRSSTGRTVPSPPRPYMVVWRS